MITNQSRGGYCAECADISPDILDTDEDDSDTSADRHRASDGFQGNIKPEREPDESGTRTHEAFADAIAYFQAQLDRDISDLGLTYVNDEIDEQTVETPREWFREVRGWSDA